MKAFQRREKRSLGISREKIKRMSFDKVEYKDAKTNFSDSQHKHESF